MKWIDYREKLGLGFSDVEKEEIFNNRVKAWIASCYKVPYDEKSEYNFSHEIGHVFLLHGGRVSDFPNTHEFHLFDQDSDNLRRVEHYLRKFDDSIVNTLSCIVALYNTYSGPQIYKLEIYNSILKILNDCNILYEILKDEDGIFIFPKGAQELDDSLVSEPLFWLKEYPQSHKAFTKALRAYSNSAEENASEIADLFRKALETFFQEFFNQEKSIENIKSEYGQYMKNNGVPKEISNNLEKTLDLYTDYMNHYAKHHDRVGSNVLEFIMYQTGNIIRLMITLKK